MKRLSDIVFLLALTLGFTASAFAEIRVAATLPVLADIARQVGGPHVTVRALAKGTEDPHYVIPRPSLMAAVTQADLFVEMGLQFELWTERLLETAGNDNVRPGQSGYVNASEGVAVLEVPERLTRSEGDIHPHGNPHVWLNPLNGIVIGRNIAEGLKRVDPEHAADYDRQLAEFSGKVSKAMESWMKRAKAIQGIKIVTYHKEWSYLAQVFGIDVRNTIEEKPGIPPSAAHRDRVLAQMKREGISVIVLAPFEVNSVSNRMAKMSGGRVVVVPTNVGGSLRAIDFFSLFNDILSELSAAVSGGS